MESQEDIQKLQMLEQNLSNIVASKQAIQTQKLEVESALSELKGKTKAFKIVGNVMVETEAENLRTDLEEKHKLIDLRLNSLEKQETELKKKGKELQKKVVDEIRDDEDDA